MKKFLLALTALAAMTGSTAAADLGARPYVKALAPAPVQSWTGFYIFGGGGGGLWSADSNIQSTGVAGGFGAFGPAGTAITRDTRLGGSGWFGTVGAGYDWQFNGRWVAGVFADGQFGDISGSLTDPAFWHTEGRQKLRTSYTAGARLGYLVAPNVLSYVNAGYTGSDWSGTTLFDTCSALPAGAHTNSFDSQGWFVGGGVENNLDIFGISAPGWFMKTEYRAAYYDKKTVDELVDGTNALVGNSITFHPLVQTISTSLVYRFNWTGPAVSHY